VKQSLKFPLLFYISTSKLTRGHEQVNHTDRPGRKSKGERLNMKQIMKTFLLLLVLTIALAGCPSGGGDGAAAPAAGTLDTSFNVSGTYPGKVITDADFDATLDAHYSFINGLAVQSDGKIIVVGHAGDAWCDFAVDRYKTDGTLDTASFNNGGATPGVVNTSFYGDIAGNGAQANAVAIDSSGNIVVAGGANRGLDAAWFFALARYNSSDGLLDASFGTSPVPGTVMTQIAASPLDDRIYAIAIQPDGKIVVAGYSNDGAKNIFAVVRYTSAGLNDGSFGTGGIVTYAFGTHDSVANAIAIQADGKIVVGGYSGTARVFTLMRLSGTDGSLDTSFGGTGIVTTAIGTADDEINALSLQSDGKIVAVGYSQGSSGQDSFAVARYTTAGVLDTTFSSTGTPAGTVTTAIGTNTDIATAAAIDSSGRIVTAGYTWTGSTFEFALVRYNADGSIDTSFGTGGKLTTQVGTTRSMAYAIALQSDGKIVAGGFSKDVTDIYDYFTLVRYWP
jgi:uncharacterized delta-60 repeat protein